MIEKSVENTGVSAGQITTVADGGYAASAGQVKAAEEGFNVLVNRSRDEIKKFNSTFHQQNFTYDEDSDSFRCPYGGYLAFSSISKKACTCEEVRRYKCKDYKKCPYRDACSKDKTGRTIKVDALKYREARARNLKRIQEPENKALLDQRGLVELMFGYIKRVIMFRRWALRGLDNVKTQWAMMCSVINLRKMYNGGKTVG